LKSLSERFFPSWSVVVKSGACVPTAKRLTTILLCHRPA
jgi:hypothetical protein